MKKILVTGGSGFIGINFIKLLSQYNYHILNVDKETYAATQNIDRLFPFVGRYEHVKVDICDYINLENVVNSFEPEYVVHFAAESHVDNSINNPDVFIQTNVNGTYNLVDICHKHVHDLKKFIHVSTDEVYGSLERTSSYKFYEGNPYLPNSPYAASKASSDLIVRSYVQTHKFPAIITHCSNNFGPFQHSEKFIPTCINAINEGKKVPVYGDGLNIRDWIHVDDHCNYLYDILFSDIPHDVINIGANNEKTNIDIVDMINELISEVLHQPAGKLQDIIEFVTDRKGHDVRYGINTELLNENFGEIVYTPRYFKQKLKETVLWSIFDNIVIDKNKELYFYDYKRNDSKIS